MTSQPILLFSYFIAPVEGGELKTAEAVDSTNVVSFGVATAGVRL